MIPQSGSINIIGESGTINVTNNAGTLTGTITIGSNLLLVTATPVVALDAIRTTTGLFLNLVATVNFSQATRISNTRSPVGFNITGVSWAAGTTTLTVSTLPLAPINNMKIHVEGAQNTSFNGTFVATGTHSTTTIQIPQASDPGTGFTGARVFPGIVDSVAGTGDGCIGYYTINRPALANVTAGSLSATTRNPMVVPAGTTHVIPSSGTATVANLGIDAVGSTPLPCGQLLALRNLKGGNIYTGTGNTSGTDVLRLIYATYNPTGNP